MTESPAPRAFLHRRFLTTDRGMIERFGDPFRPLEPECRVIQLGEPLAAAQLQAVGGLITDRPDVQLYVYRDASTNLDFLRYFGTLRRLQVALYKLEDITGFSHVRYLEELTFGETKRTFSLRFLGTLLHLKALFLARGVLSYQRFVSNDGAQVHVYERYANSAAALAHLENFGTRFAARFEVTVTRGQFTVFGQPDDPALKEVLDRFGAVYLRPFGDFQYWA
jgi:hypothetical protein